MAIYEFHVEAEWAAALREAGILSVADVLDRAERIRDLPDRANLRLDVGGTVVHVKHYKRRSLRPYTHCREYVAATWAREQDLPTAEPVCAGVDRTLGAVAGFADLAPARPLDDLLREGALTGEARRRVLGDLSRTVGRLHALRHHHRDLYLNHVYVDPAADEPLVAIIDWDRADQHRQLLGRWAVKDVASLDASIPDGTVSDTERFEFLVRYLRTVVGADGRACLADFGARVERKAARIRTHVPRTPVGEAAR